MERSTSMIARMRHPVLLVRRQRDAGALDGRTVARHIPPCNTFPYMLYQMGKYVSVPGAYVGALAFVWGASPSGAEHRARRRERSPDAAACPP